MQWYLAALSKYATFDGRARRREYWMFYLINLLIVFALVVVDNVIGTWMDAGSIGLLSGLYILGVLIPTFAVGVRRLHDTGRTGWWLLINLVPLIGPLIVFIFHVQDSAAHDNAYGPNPKAQVA